MVTWPFLFYLITNIKVIMKLLTHPVKLPYESKIVQYLANHYRIRAELTPHNSFKYFTTNEKSKDGVGLLKVLISEDKYNHIHYVLYTEHGMFDDNTVYIIMVPVEEIPVDKVKVLDLGVDVDDKYMEKHKDILVDLVS